MTRKPKAKPLAETEIPTAYSLEKHGVTQSILSLFGDCRFAAELMLQGWGSPSPRRALQFGSLFHALLENWYAASIARRGSDPGEIFRATAKAWEKKAAIAGDDPQEIQTDLGMASVMFPGYCKRWEKEDAKKKWIAVESLFDYQKFSYRLRGKMDGAFKAKDGSVWLLETKTTSVISDEQLQLQLAFNFQNLFYLLALAHRLSVDPAGVLYNIIRKPQIGRGEDRSSPEFLKRLKEDIAARPEFYFVRYEISYPAMVRTRFAEELFLKLKAFAAWRNGIIPTYRNEMACLKKQWSCNFLPVCAAGGDPEKAGFKRNRKLFSELEE